MTSTEIPKTDGKDKYVLKFHDEGQRAHYKSRAALNRRSLNAELLFLIESGEKAVDGAKVEAEKGKAPNS